MRLVPSPQIRLAGIDRNQRTVVWTPTLTVGLLGVLGQGIGLPSASNTRELAALFVGFVGVFGHGIGFPSASSFSEFTALNAGFVGVFGHGIGFRRQLLELLALLAAMRSETD